MARKSPSEKPLIPEPSARVTFWLAVIAVVFVIVAGAASFYDGS
jgi:hypothetical protein